MLLDACASLIHDKEGTLVIAGPAKDHEMIRQRARDLNLERFITWAGNLSHTAVPELLSQCEIAVLPNANTYQNPIKLFEYGAMGCAVVAPPNRPH